MTYIGNESYYLIARPLDIALNGGITSEKPDNHLSGASFRSRLNFMMARENEAKESLIENLHIAVMCAERYRRLGRSEDVAEALAPLYCEYLTNPEQRMRNLCSDSCDDKDTLQMRIEATKCLESLLKKEEHLGFIFKQMGRVTFDKNSIWQMIKYCCYSDIKGFNATDCIIGSIVESGMSGKRLGWEELYSEIKNYIVQSHTNPNKTFLKTYIQFLPVAVVMRYGSSHNTEITKELYLLKDKNNRDILSALYRVMLNLTIISDYNSTISSIVKFAEKYSRYASLMRNLISLMRTYRSEYFKPHHERTLRYLNRLKSYPQNHELDNLFNILFTESEINGYSPKITFDTEPTPKPTPKTSAAPSPKEDAGQDAVSIKDICEMFKNIPNPKTCEELFGTISIHLRNEAWQKHQRAIADIVEERLKDGYDNTTKGVRIEGGTYVEQQYINGAKKPK